MSNEMVPAGEQQLTVTRHGILIRNIDDLRRFADTVAKSGLAPRGLDTASAIAVAIEMGLELGLPPMAALQNIAVINGRPAIYGDAALALCKSHPAWDESAFKEEIITNEKGEPVLARCTVRRKPGNPVVQEFSIEDAKCAGLWGKRGQNGQPTPWTQYPKRMLQMRARGFALRDAFPDVLKGLRLFEEARDIPADADVVDVQAAPVPTQKDRVERLVTAIAGPKEKKEEAVQDGAKEEEVATPTATNGNTRKRTSRQKATLFEEEQHGADEVVEEF